MWRFNLDGYLREILTARVYDVAVSTVRKRHVFSLFCMQEEQQEMQGRENPDQLRIMCNHMGHWGFLCP
eukprot:452221-Pelagomonas_calceolata.AAC.2